MENIGALILRFETWQHRICLNEHVILIMKYIYLNVYIKKNMRYSTICTQIDIMHVT